MAPRCRLLVTVIKRRPSAVTGILENFLPVILRPLRASAEIALLPEENPRSDKVMAHDNPEQLPMETSPEDRIPPSSSAEPSLSRNTSSRRLNAQAAEFVPRPPPASHAQARMEPRVVQIHHAPAAPPPVMHIFRHHHQPPSPPHQAFHHVPVVQGHSQFEYYGGGEGGCGDHEMVHSPVDPDPATAPSAATSDGLPDDVIQKITKQVEYYFSDTNLATTEHLMRFISKDPEGLVPISVIAAFKKIKALISNTAQLAAALRASSKLIVSDDGKKVRRLHPFTEADVEELQSRIIVAENLPEDHCYQNLLKVFSVVGSVKAIRTCYPQTTNGTTSTTSRPGKIDTIFGNKLHAFVEYETIEDAEKAVAELNDERNWRSGLRVRLLSTCMGREGLLFGAGSLVDGFVGKLATDRPRRQQAVGRLREHGADVGLCLTIFISAPGMIVTVSNSIPFLGRVRAAANRWHADICRCVEHSCKSIWVILVRPSSATLPPATYAQKGRPIHHRLPSKSQIFGKPTCQYLRSGVSQ